jgi:hypothetical protein
MPRNSLIAKASLAGFLAGKFKGEWKNKTADIRMACERRR